MTVAETVVLSILWVHLGKDLMGRYYYLLAKERETQTNEISDFEDENTCIDMDPIMCI